VETLGRNPQISLVSGGALGSGCSPGTDTIPDGVWFGWIEDTGSSGVDFDLACLWPGRLEPAASNDATRIRDIEVADVAVVYLSADPIDYVDWSGQPGSASNAPGLPDDLPYWLFVNNGVVTEMAEYPEPVTWALAAAGWPGLIPGCCDGGTVAPSSPEGSWPESGWPADGFYSAHLVDYGAWLDIGDPASYDLEVRHYLSCDESPELCPEWWTGDEVTIDPDEVPLLRSLPFDSDLRVTIMPIFGETPIIGSGHAYADLIDDIRESRAPLGDPEEDWDAFFAAVRKEIADPDSPFGIPASPDSTAEWPLGYKGPGDAYLTFEYPPWMVLEIRDGLPVLYIHAGLVAG
jgi:hypothetical protein